ncbi:MAG: hypothetical protein KDK51_11070, partial [Deltaproteobacteria bacterium]|nr:hypothetical protein [Deltaproteobacteria bacterium]
MSSYLGFKEIDDWQVEWEKHRSEPECLVERDKRYGRVFDVFDEEKIYVVRVVLPQKPPHHPWLYQYGLPKHLKPYLMQAKIVDDVLLISGVIQDVDLAKLCGLINSFP